LIRSKRGLLTVGLVTLVLGLTILFPARVAVHWFLPDVVTLTGIQGTVWSGTASEASVSGIYCRDIHWHMKPSRLFAGEISYRASATLVSGFVESDVGVGLSGMLTLTNLTAALPLNSLAGVSGLPGLQGNASLTFERLVFDGDLAIAADGNLQIANLIVPIISRESLGGYKAEFFTQNNGVIASVEDTEAPIDLAGSFQLNSDRSYQFTGQVVARPETPQSLREQMRFLPPANERGQQEIRLEGVL
jgi:general secretion pathway protein N